MKVTKSILRRLIRQSIKESRYAVSPTGVARKFDRSDMSFDPSNPGYYPQKFSSKEKLLQHYFGVNDVSELATDAEKAEAQGVLDAFEKGQVYAQSAERQQRTGSPIDPLDLDEILPVGTDTQIRANKKIEKLTSENPSIKQAIDKIKSLPTSKESMAQAKELFYSILTPYIDNGTLTHKEVDAFVEYVLYAHQGLYYTGPHSNYALGNKSLARSIKYPQYKLVKNGSIRADPAPFSMSSIDKRTKDLEKINDPSHRDVYAYEWEEKGGMSKDNPRLTQKEASIYDQLFQSSTHDLFEHVKSYVYGFIENTSEGATINSLTDIDVMTDWMLDYDDGKRQTDEYGEGFATSLLNKFPNIVKMLVYEAAIDLEDNGEVLFYHPADDDYRFDYYYGYFPMGWTPYG